MVRLNLFSVFFFFMVFMVSVICSGLKKLGVVAGGNGKCCWCWGSLEL